MSIELDLDTDLQINSINQLDIKKAEGSTLEIKPDGLYASAPKGPNGAGGSGYNVTGDYDGIRIGRNDPFTNTTEAGRILAKPIVHRVFTATDSSGTNLINFRPDLDYVFPGDMFCVQNGTVYDYYIIKTVNGYEGKVGNSVTSAAFLGSW